MRYVSGAARAATVHPEAPHGPATPLGIETMHAIKKGQLGCHQGLVASDADCFYSLATR